MTTFTDNEKKQFSFIARLKSSNHAFRGLFLFLRTGHNAWLQIVFSVLALYLGFLFHISKGEWLALVIVIGLTIIIEAINTAIEVDIDLTSPEYHPFARDTKDVAAGAVLLSGILAIVVSLIIFLPRLFPLLFK
jgi:diacylglycerol kinase